MLMGTQRENLIKEQLATRNIISQLKGTKQILKHNYACSQSIVSEIDFLLGSVIGRILERCINRQINRKVSFTPEEFLWVKIFVFTGLEFDSAEFTKIYPSFQEHFLIKSRY
jgi:hypothetical protein